MNKETIEKPTRPLYSAEEMHQIEISCGRLQGEVNRLRKLLRVVSEGMGKAAEACHNDGDHTGAGHFAELARNIDQQIYPK